MTDSQVRTSDETALIKSQSSGAGTAAEQIKPLPSAGISCGCQF